MLVLLTTVTAVETLRVLFSVAYHAGETLGNVPSGLVVVAILATPVAMKKLSIPNAPFGLGQIAIDPLLAALAGLGITGVAMASRRRNGTTDDAR